MRLPIVLACLAPGFLFAAAESAIAIPDSPDLRVARFTDDPTPLMEWRAGAGGIESYEFRVDGSGWLATTEPRIVLPELALGAHEFGVRGQAADGSWSDPVDLPFLIVEKPVAPLHYQVQFKNFDHLLVLDPLRVDTSDPYQTGLPETFESFKARVQQDELDVSSTVQSLRSMYLLGTGAYRNAAFPDYLPELFEAALDLDESAFLHSTDPALVTLTDGFQKVFLYWRGDERFASTGAKYRIFRHIPTGPHPDPDWWQSVPWFEVTKPDYQSEFLVYQDGFFRYADDEASPFLGFEVCYRIESEPLTPNPQSTVYSLPACITHEGIVDPRHFLRSFTVDTTSAVVPTDACVNPAPTEPFEDRENACLAAGQCLCNEYVVQARVKQTGVNDVAQVDLVEYGSNGPDGQNCAKGQCRRGFGEVRRFCTPQPGETVSGGTCKLGFGELSEGDEVVTWTLHLARPLLASLPLPGGASVTEEPIFRIEVRPASGGPNVVFPSDGGYFLTNLNNRISNRFFDWRITNPGNDTYRAAVLGLASDMADLGYNALFLDEWRPFLPFSSEVNVDPIDFERPPPFTPPSPPASDPWVDALNEMIQDLQGDLDALGMRTIGNSLKVDGDEGDGQSGSLAEAAAASLDIGFYEGCILKRGIRVDGTLWEDQLSYIEALDPAKGLICQLRQTDKQIMEPQDRLYGLASYLLVHDPSREMYLGIHEINPIYGRWELATECDGPSPSCDDYRQILYPFPNLNILPEFFVDLGAPTPGGRTSPQPLVWERSFERGVVIVNAGDVGTTVSLPTGDFQSVEIEGVVTLERNGPDCKQGDPDRLCEMNPGRLTLTNESGSITVAGTSGAILVRTPQCQDGVDNDQDGDVDHPSDVGCSFAHDPSEGDPDMPCDNGIDDDGDSLIDVSEDPGCRFASSPREDPSCDDGVDNDSDGDVDLADSNCSQSHTNCGEKACGGNGNGCGLGAELVLLLPAWIALQRARRRRSVARDA